MRKCSSGEHESDVRDSRCIGIRRCANFWLNLSDADQELGLTLLKKYWTNPGDMAEVLGDFCKHYAKDRQQIETFLDAIYHGAKIAWRILASQQRWPQNAQSNTIILAPFRQILLCHYLTFCIWCISL